ncbi:MAG: peptidoglycan DD-metalloendopeptidase family protein [Bacteroidetes bacterium]|nr:peptidoglycan DD-metalloendopeptidase family protein [Bacteroidota bacterium]
MKNSKVFTLIISGLLLVLFIITTTSNKPKETPAIIIVKSVKKINTEFGIDTSAVVKQIHSVKRNETLSKILLKYKTPYNKIYQAQILSKNLFDLRKIIYGHKYYSYSSTDNSNSLQYFVYEISPIDYLVINFKDTVSVDLIHKKIVLKKKIVSGVIKNSLYMSLAEQNVDPGLVINLSEIYAWQIDFYRIMEGDKYKVIYEEKYVDDKPVGINKIIGAEFFYRKENYYAINYKTNNKNEYYDEKGNSLQKTFLKAPIKFSRISSRFTYRRFHPVQKRYKAHLGTDYAAPQGTPIHAVGDGIIITSAYSKYNGRYIKVKHNGTYSTQYLHMYKIASGIRPGVKVKQGQIIGYVGHTGLARGNHVCFRFWKNGQQVNPLKQKIPASKPIVKKYLDDFNRLKEKIITELKNIDFVENNNTSTASL